LAKGRACRYEVVGVHKKGVANTAFKSTVVDQEYKGNVASTQEEVLGTASSRKGEVVSIEDAMAHFGCTRSALRRRCQRQSSARWSGSKVMILS